MTPENYRKAIMDALGNPTSGLFVDYMDTIVSAVVGLDAKTDITLDAVAGSRTPRNVVADTRPIKETRRS